jgi:hypothetical protein
MFGKRTAAAGITAPIGNHSLRATGLIAYLENGGVLEHGQDNAAHASRRTAKVYDRTKERLTGLNWRKSGRKAEIGPPQLLDHATSCHASGRQAGHRLSRDVG